MKVEHDGKVYEFDPDKQRKDNFLDFLAKNLPLPMKHKIWLSQQAVKLRGIKITEDTEGGEEC